MRSVERENSPRPNDFSDYRGAFPFLAKRLGLFCSYCERPILTNLAVEHIQPKGLRQYSALIGRWDNFLLGCVNCNGAKTDKDVVLTKILLPDRDNTAAAFDYTPDGKVVPAAHLSPAQKKMAKAALALTGLDKTPRNAIDENGQLVALERVSQRMQAWGIAEESRKELVGSPTEAMRRQVVRTAVAQGFFSIWMKVFEGDIKTRKMLIKAFVGTAQTCFDPQTTKPISPRPSNGLAGGGKV